MISEIQSLPDYPALEQLARALWRNGTVRGAAILVGAGFSLNASTVSADTPKPPLWSDLNKDLTTEIYPSKADRTRAPTNPLRIAEEYRTVLGQASLDDFIKKRFPDKSWLPGDLHQALLELEWSDVLTTNWDTLLERAAGKLRDRVYEVVKYEADLPHARAPRIVKLHGTLGDPTPLIFAEEDYRTYPVKHAAFVNLARQIFIENELCLIGFSGDDPNFLEWAGWVRDQLGGNARRIYIAGNLNLPPATRQYFEAHNIAPIDLAPLLSGHPVSAQHAEATRIFINCLKAAKPSPVDKWSKIPFNEHPLTAGGPNAHERASKDPAFAAELLEKTIPLFATDRSNYPGWLVCPWQERRDLEYGGEEAWLLRPEAIELLPPAKRLDLLDELLWRRTTGYAPIISRFVEALSSAVEAWPSEGEPQRKLGFALALMRDARIDDNETLFQKWGALVEATASADSPARTEALYQRCLRARDHLDHPALATLVVQLTAEDPIWKMRRAALHAELAECATAERLIKEAVSDLEQSYRLNRGSLWLKSRLGWADWLSRGTELWRTSGQSDHDAPRSFKSENIDPDRELSRFRDGASDMISQHYNESGIHAAFEPGHYRDNERSLVMLGGESGWRLAFALDQLIETVGLPISINHVDISGYAIRETALVTYQRTFPWYVRLLRAVHMHDDRPFSRFFGRLAIAQLDEGVAQHLIEKIKQAIEFWIDRLRSSQSPDLKDDRSLAVDRLRLMLSTLSHLTIRMAPDTAKSIYFRAAEIAKEPVMRHYWLTEALGNLCTRAVAATPQNQREELILTALELPLPAELRVEERFWPDVITPLWDIRPSRPPNDTRWNKRVNELVEAAGKTSPSRAQAIMRLAYLHKHRALSPSESESFSKALWSDVDANEQSLPTNTNLLVSTFVELPAPEGVDVGARVRHRLVRHNWIKDLALTSNSLDITNIQNLLVALHNAKPLGVVLDDADARSLFDVLVQWRPKPITRNDPISVSMYNSFVEGIRMRMGDAISVSVAPFLSSADLTDDRLTTLFGFINEIKAWRALPALVSFLNILVGRRDEIVAAIQRGLVAADHQHVGAAAYALARWVRHAKRGGAPEVPRTLVDQLVSSVETRAGHGLSTLINVMAFIVKQDLCNSSDYARLLFALASMREDSRYMEIELDDPRAISISLVRKECVRLAKALRNRVIDDGSLTGWLEDARNDPLPEVRFEVDQNEDPARYD